MPLYEDKTLIDAASALDTAGGFGNYVGSRSKFTKFLVKFGAGTSAGVVIIEESDQETDTGLWANLSTVSWAAANRSHSVQVEGPHKAIRARIGTAIVGGTVTVTARVVS